MPDNPKPASQTPAIHSVHIEQQDAHVWAYLDSFSRHGGRGGIASLDDAKRLWAMADGLDRMTDELDEIEALPRATTFLDKDARRKRIDELKALIHPEPATEGAAPEPQAAPAAPPSEPGNWKMVIQAEAAARFKRLRAAGSSPVVYSILDDMVMWCRANDVKTDGGVFPSAGYLRTHVLGGKHWTPPR